MKRIIIAAWLVAGCTDAGTPKKNGSVRIDISALRQAQASGGFGALSGVGLLVVRGKLASLEEETAKLDTTAGAAATATTTTTSTTDGTTPSATTVDVGGPLPPTTNTGTLPARGGAAPADVQGTLAAPQLSDAAANDPVSAADVPPVSYYPIALDPATPDAFAIELPAGQVQNMFLIGFAEPASATGRPMPTYVAAALDVTLKAQEDTEVVFSAYPAGVAIPQFLPPTTLGLVDASGTPIKKLPQMSCLAVATSMAPRADFPAVSLSRVNIGTLSAQLQNAGVPGLFVLPTGHYKVDCLAAFAGKVFGVDPAHPLEFDVVQGQAALPTAGLVKLRDLPVDPTMPATGLPGPGGTTLPGGGTPLPSGGGTTVLPPVSDPHYSVYVSQTIPLVARGGGALPGGGLAGGTLFSTESNFTTAAPGDLTVVARNPDGTVNVDSYDHIVVEMRPAYVVGQFGQDLLTGSLWLPFLVNAKPVVQFDTNLDAGVVSLPGILRFPDLSATSTLQYVISVRAYDANNALLRRGGARYITVNAANACATATGDHIEMFALTDEPDTLTLNLRKDGTYQPLWEHVLLVASSAAPDRCAMLVTANGLGLTFQPKDATTFASLEFSSAFTPLSNAYSLAVPPIADSQGVLWDAVRPSPNLGAARPTVGTILSNLSVATFVTATPLLSRSVWGLRIGVRAAP